MICSLFSALMLAFPYLSTAAPVHPVELLAWSPTILSPDEFTVWSCGSVQSVTWRTDNIPEEKQNSTGLLLLGYEENNSENLDISTLIFHIHVLKSLKGNPAEHPLAVNFPLTLGSVSFTVPQNATPRTDAIVVCMYCLSFGCAHLSHAVPVFGDSGNASPQFTIVCSEPY